MTFSQAGSGVGTVNDPACYLFDAPTVQRLAEYEADLPTIRTSWVLGRERRGELCEVCTCAETSADCRGRDLRAVSIATAARGRPSYATVEPLLERLYPRTFEWSRQAADGSTVTEQAPLFGDLIDAVKWYADREEGAAGEPPDFAPGTNARRRTALKKPPARPSRLLSAMSFRSTRSLATSPSVTSSRKSLPPSSG